MHTLHDDDNDALMNVDDNDDRLAPNGHLRVYQALPAGFWSVSRVGICKFFQQKNNILGKYRVSIFCAFVSFSLLPFCFKKYLCPKYFTVRLFRT